MNYPGNETLAEEIRGRILNTFRQTLDLAEKGDLREAQLGCDFVLRLDPMFGPARTLTTRLEGGDEAVPVADLRESIGGGSAEAGPPPADVGASESAPEPAPEVPSEGSPGPDEPVVELDLDAAPDSLDTALDLGSIDAAPPAAAPEMPSPASSPPGAEAGSGATEPVAALDDESEQRVGDLLEEGQAAFERAEYQSAIDAWSRIFLIDIDHPEANRRIDLARKLKAEVERKLEETYHDAVSKVEAGQLDEARKGFSSVLEMMPGHVAAQEYLARLDAPDFAVPEPPPAPPPSPAAANGAPEDSVEIPAPPPDEASDILDAEVMTPPEATPAGPAPSIGGVGKAAKPQRSSNQTFKIIGAAALVLVAAVSFLLYKNWSTIFPNAADQTQPVRLDPITRAKRTYADAGAAIAIAQLRRLSPGHPQYAEAQSLVAQWEAALDAANPNKIEPEPEALAARDEFVAEARVAFAEARYLNVAELLDEGASHAELDEPASDMLDEAKQQLAPMQSEIAMFREGEWELALRNLWRMWEGGSNTPDVRRLMVDSYFNLGVRDLQRNDPEAAINNFREAGDLAIDDAELARLIEFAETYQTRSQDLLYRIFVKYLPFR
ncbi:MAG: hypothetical protein ACE5GX_05760 [Thermoanaerobaculia bacterium]